MEEKRTLFRVSFCTDKKQLPYELFDRLAAETRKFMEEFKCYDPAVIIGGANLYLAGTMMQAPSKEQAKSVLESDFDIIRAIIADTPDEMFRVPHVNIPEE